QQREDDRGEARHVVTVSRHESSCQRIDTGRQIDTSQLLKHGKAFQGPRASMSAKPVWLLRAPPLALALLHISIPTAPWRRPAVCAGATAREDREERFM